MRRNRRLIWWLAARRSDAMQGRTLLPSSRVRSWGMAALVGGLVLACYWPALRGGLVWDDEAHVTRPDLRSCAGLGRIWFDMRATQQYYPVLHSAFWIEHRLWGDATLGYHLVNVLLHAAACCLLAVVLRRLWEPEQAASPGPGRCRPYRPPQPPEHESQQAAGRRVQQHVHQMIAQRRIAPE